MTETTPSPSDVPAERSGPAEAGGSERGAPAGASGPAEQSGSAERGAPPGVSGPAEASGSAEWGGPAGGSGSAEAGDSAVVASHEARELVRGAYDLHIHIDPDVVGRIVDDVTLAERFADRGLAGFGLKSHYTSTAERARVVNRVAPDGVRAIGTITLNAAIGGLNPLAVEIAAREGARIVWLPTVDAVNEATARDREYPPGARVPMWVALQKDLREQGMEAPPVAVVDEAGEPLPQLHDVLSVVARHQLILATGHLHRDEIFTVVDAALAKGIADVVVTHPEFTAQNLSIEDQVALAEKGAILERCFTTPYTGKCSFDHVADGIRATGPERNLLSTDLGQPSNPPVEEGLALFVDRLLERGFAEEEIHTMTVLQSRRLAAGSPVAASDAAERA